MFNINIHVDCEFDSVSSNLYLIESKVINFCIHITYYGVEEKENHINRNMLIVSSEHTLTQKKMRSISCILSCCTI